MFNRRLLLLSAALLIGCPQSTEDKEELCPADACSGHGRCVVEAGRPRCACDEYYVSVGLTCAVNCLEIGCSGRGGCIEVENEGHCICDQGYYAPPPDKQSCEANEPETCDLEDCSGHGTCVEVTGESARCICEQGWVPFGLSCVEASCRGVVCSGHGACVEADGLPLCRCDPGYESVGLGCVASDCSLTDCSGHGGCVDDGGQARCVCDHGYVAVGLECRPEACAREACSGHGACVEEGGNLRCICDPGYVADEMSCRPGCVELDCSGHGACIQSGGALRCVCDPGYEARGTLCEAPAPGGDSDPDGGDGGELVDGSAAPDGGGDSGGVLDGGADGSAGSDGSPDGGGGGDAGEPRVPGTWVLIDVSGTPFTMGSPVTELGRYTNEVEHEVTLTRNYWLMTTEITQQQYQDEMGYNPSWFSVDGSGADCGLNCPVEYVSWHEVAAYANALSVLEGLGECYECSGTEPDFLCSPSGSYATPYDCPGYRLPTEAEWEYAARGGDGRATYAGELTATDCTDTTLDPIAWFCGNASGTTHPVGTKTANAYGLYDMLGNVWEWCHDWNAAYPGGAETDPAGPPSGSFRVHRGGSWAHNARYARAAIRYNAAPGTRFSDFGGRISRSVP